MVADLIHTFTEEPTGAVRMRVVKRRQWFGARIIIEREHVTRTRRMNPHAPVLRTGTIWLRVSKWEVLGRNFYSEVRATS